jgi:hypothetical protein
VSNELPCLLFTMLLILARRSRVDVDVFHQQIRRFIAMNTCISASRREGVSATAPDEPDLHESRPT